jgi:arylsulfatase A-like enzyme
VRKLVPLLLVLLGSAPQDRRPNVLLIVTDDQGYGDLGCHGNPQIKTPRLDALAKESYRFDSFYVSPVCSPTRASLLTGRYNYRTGVVDTFLGRAMMHADEVTIAEMLGSAGYRTGIFGKWHLGDNYPLRPQDQGFQECLTIRGGGIGQPSDPPGGDHYTDATMYRNGKPFKTKGYCTDVLTDAALDFIGRQKDTPFFAYVPFNAPHTPLEAPEADLKPYREAGLPDITARVYAMVSNIDANVGRLLARLEDLKLAEETIVIFMSDNGPQQERYNAGMRGLKGQVYEGGIRVPFFLRWPQWTRADPRRQPRTIPTICAHIDVVPTLLEACRVEKPAGLIVDGQSLLSRTSQVTHQDSRTLFFQWHRGDVPEKFRAAAARDPGWKLIWLTPQSRPMLFNLLEDPGEKTNLESSHADVVERLTKAYDDWFEDVKKTRNFAAPQIVLDPEHENPAVLTRQDWGGPKAGWAADSDGFWRVDVAKETRYDVMLRFRPPGATCKITYSRGGKSTDAELAADATSVSLPGVVHTAGPTQLSATIVVAKPYGVDYIELKRAD